jgi:hypothetical protein
MRASASTQNLPQCVSAMAWHQQAFNKTGHKTASDAPTRVRLSCPSKNYNESDLQEADPSDRAV